MKKNFKIIFSIIGVIIAAFLLKSDTLLCNVFGIVGIYLCIYLFMKTVMSILELKCFYLKEIITILVAYNLQKSSYLLYKNISKENMYLIPNVIMIILFSSIFFYNLYKDNRIKKDEILNLCYEYLIMSVPFYIIKSRGRQTLILVCLIVLLNILKKREITFNFNLKKGYISIIILIISLSLSFIGNNMDKDQISQYNHLCENLMFLIIFIQMKLSDSELKKFITVGITSSIIPIIPIIVEFLRVRNFSYRLGEDNPNIWAMEAILWVLIYLYIVLFKNKKEFVIMYALYLIGVFLSGSRGAILTILVTNFFIFIYKNRKQKKILCSIFIIILLVGVGILNTNNRISYTINLIKNEKKIDNSSSIRLIIYKEALNQFKISPINGLGFDGYHNNSIERHIKNNNREFSYIEKIAYTASHAHNSLLNLLCGTGLLGTVSYLAMLFFIYKKIYTEKKTIEGLFIIILMISYEMYGLVECTIRYYNVQRFLYLIIGIYIAYTTPKISLSKKEKLEQ